ncbi:cuticulin-1 [Aphelenchoides avenae]|nr:cuticulin-1 [Aphelenchus avenae]
MQRYSALVTIVALFAVANAIPVDNGVEGEPEIECGPTSITVNFNTRNPFEGHVYVKGLFDQAGCRSDEHGRQVAGITLPFDSCNVARTRSLNPRGVFVTTTVVISFHPQFVTKVDRAYRVQCFYMEADKTVSQQLEVSEITTLFQTQVVPMPVCRYEILEGGPTGQPIRFATIGQQVYHKWTCDTETQNTFCAVVHTCTVDDGAGDNVQIINPEGCALDRFLLNNLEYPTDLSAGQEAHVYKFADRAQLFYQCQISITIKEPNTECPRPQCAEPTGFGAQQLGGGPAAGGNAGAAGAGAPPPSGAAPTGAGPTGAGPTGTAPAASTGPARGRSAAQFRLLKKREADFENTMDVRAEFNALDISDKNAALPAALRHRSMSQIGMMPSQEGICMSPFGLSLFLIAGVAFMGAVVAAVTCSLRPQRKI